MTLPPKIPATVQMSLSRTPIDQMGRIDFELTPSSRLAGHSSKLKRLHMSSSLERNTNATSSEPPVVVSVRPYSQMSHLSRRSVIGKNRNSGHVLRQGLGS